MLSLDNQTLHRFLIVYYDKKKAKLMKILPL